MIYFTILTTFLAGAGLGALACLYLTGRRGAARHAGADERKGEDADGLERSMRKQYENFFSYTGDVQPGDQED